MKIVFSLWVFLLGGIRFSWAELHISETKGLSEIIQLSPQCAYLAPLHAPTDRFLSRYTNIINYAPESKIKSADQSELFIQSVFSVPPGTDNPIFFRTSPLSRKFGRFLSPTTLGKILATIEASDPVKNPKALKDSLKTVITNDSDFGYLRDRSQEEASEILKRRNILETQLTEKSRKQICELKVKQLTSKWVLKAEKMAAHCEQAPLGQIRDSKENIESLGLLGADLEEQDEYTKKILALEEENKLLLSSDEQYKMLTDQYNSYRYENGHLNSFLEQLVKSLQAERSPGGGSAYPKYFTEQALLTLAWLNTPDHEKSYFVRLYEQLPETCFKQNTKPNPSHPLMKERFTAKDYQILKEKVEQLPEDERARYLLNHPEQAIFLVYGKRFFDPTDIPVLAFKTVSLKHPTQGQVSFPDCMDSSILNFLSIAAKDRVSGLISGKALQVGLNGHGYHLSKDVEGFLNSHQDPGSLDTLRAHEQWAPLVSFLPNVSYKKKDYEILSGIDNFFAVMGHMIQPIQKGMPPLFHGLVTRVEKMDKLCKILSREGFELSWDVVSGAKKEEINGKNYASIVFDLDEEPKFEWKFSKGHSELFAGEEEDHWTHGVGSHLSNVMREKERSHQLTDLDYKLMASFARLQELPKLAENLKFEPNSTEYVLLQQALQISDVEAKVGLAATLLRRDPNSLEWVRRLIRSVPATDVRAQVFVMNLFMSQGFDQKEGFREEFENAAEVIKREQNTAVLFSAENQLLGTLHYMNSQGISFDVADKDKNNPLHILLKKKFPSVDCIRFISSVHPSLLTRAEGGGLTPLLQAIDNRNGVVVRALFDEMVSRGLDINAGPDRTLSHALTRADIDTVKLVAAHENKTLRQALEEFTDNSVRVNPLTYMVIRANFGILKYVFDHEKELFSELVRKVYPPSHLALSMGPLEFLSATMSKQGDASDPFYQTRIQAVLDQVPEMLTIKNSTGKSLLHLMAGYNRPDVVQSVLQVLGNRVGDAFFLDRDGTTPLHQAAFPPIFGISSQDSAKALELRQEMLSVLYKANPAWAHIKDRQGKTPLDYIKSPELIQFFKKLSGNPGSTNTLY